MAATFSVTSATLGTSLTQLLTCDEIQPGSDASYQACKTIFLYHPLGAKMTETPVKMAQSLGRELSIKNGFEDDLRAEFEAQWRRDGANDVIKQLGTLARVYGIASLALLEKDVQPGEAMDPSRLADASISFNVLDPLNTAGSLVLNQDPNAIDFQKHKDIAVNGKPYHRSRTVTLMNEQPIYIAYTDSAFGFVGRSVYQRALFPLKSFISTMVTDDMVSRKAGLIVATLKMAGSIVDAVMSAAAGFKRGLLKQAETDNVVSIGEGETVASLDLTNIDGAMTTARRNILMNVATAADMPARILNHETFAEGFGEGTEDAKAEASYIDNVRSWLDPAYRFMDMVVMRRAWNPRFFKSMQSKYDTLKGKDYAATFAEWENSFSYVWPSLLRESESEMVRVDDTKMRALIAMFQVFTADADPDNKITLLEWLESQVNSTPRLFSVPLALDYDAMRQHVEDEGEAAELAAQEADAEEKVAKLPGLPKVKSDSAVAAYLGRRDDGDLRERIATVERMVAGAKRRAR